MRIKTICSLQTRKAMACARNRTNRPWTKSSTCRTAHTWKNMIRGSCLDVSLFSHVGKAIRDIWSVYIGLRTKIYSAAFQCVNLSMYIINSYIKRTGCSWYLKRCQKEVLVLRRAFTLKISTAKTYAVPLGYWAEIMWQKVICFKIDSPTWGEKVQRNAHKAGNWYLLGVLCKDFDEQPRRFHMGVLPGVNPTELT